MFKGLNEKNEQLIKLIDKEVKKIIKNKSTTWVVLCHIQPITNDKIF